MKRATYAIFLLLTLLNLCKIKAQTRNILFIGNSYLATNYMAGSVIKMGKVNGISLDIQTATPNGYRLWLHSLRSTTKNLIASRPWDYIILQEYSTGYNDPSFLQGVNDLIDIINDTQCPHQPKVCLFMTWGRNYSPTYFDAMQADVDSAYTTVAKSAGTGLIPAGLAWQKAKLLDDSIQLHGGDASHPSLLGTHLSAEMVYSYLFSENNSNVYYNPDLDSSAISFLHDVAIQTTMDSNRTWNFIRQDTIVPQPAFEHFQDQKRVKYCNSSEHYTRLAWSFGNGLRSSSEHPYSYFPIEGEYVTALTTYNHCKEKTLRKRVQSSNDIISARYSSNWLDYNANLTISFEIEPLSENEIMIYNESQGVSRSRWIIDSTVTSNEWEPTLNTHRPGEHQITYIASNVCKSDSLTISYKSELVTNQKPSVVEERKPIALINPNGKVVQLGNSKTPFQPKSSGIYIIHYANGTYSKQWLESSHYYFY